MSSLWFRALTQSVPPQWDDIGVEVTAQTPPEEAAALLRASDNPGADLGQVRATKETTRRWI